MYLLWIAFVADVQPLFYRRRFYIYGEKCMIFRKKIESDWKSVILTINDRGGISLKKGDKIWILSPAQAKMLYGGTRDVVDYVKYLEDFHISDDNDKLEFI